MNLGNFLAESATPNADGLVLVGNPGSTWQGSTQAGLLALYFYDFGSHQIKTLATPTDAPDGTQRGIGSIVAAGHWIVYEDADAGNGHWSLFAINTQTGEQRLIDSYIEEGSAPGANMYGLFATDGADLAWSVGVQNTGAPVFVLKVYNFASQQTRTLMSGPNTPIVAPYAVAGGSIVLEESHEPAQPSDGVYLWKLTDPAPQQISTDQPVNMALNDHFAIWDNPHMMTLSLYNRDTGKLTETWLQNCIRPAIALDRPYVVCLDYNHKYMILAQAPSGQATPLDSASASETGAIASERDYWMQPGGTEDFSNIVDYIDLPPS